MKPTVNCAKKHLNDIFHAGLVAADPGDAVRNVLSMQSNQLNIEVRNLQGNCSHRSEPWNKIHLIAFGKAAYEMSRIAAEIIPPGMRGDKDIIVTNDENKKELNQFEVYAASHPVPDQRGVEAAQQISARIQQAKRGELLLVLISGGGSALIPYPANGISLSDKIKTTRLLLESGASINEVNCIRKHISRLKGGNLARLAHPVDLHTVILSDVIGDDPSAIASGPTVPDPTTFNDALNILHARKLWKNLPESVSTHILAGCAGEIEETPKPMDQLFNRAQYSLIGSNSISVSAMQTAARHAEFKTEIYSTKLAGEAREEAAKLCHHAAIRITTIVKPTAIIAGGETTVTIHGHGLGGRNQEFCLAFAIEANKAGLTSGWCLLSAGTDGRDGPTDAAGAIVDGGTVPRICAKGGNTANYLSNNDSYHALKLAGDLMITGATGTNVADLLVLLLFPE